MGRVGIHFLFDIFRKHDEHSFVLGWSENFTLSMLSTLYVTPCIQRYIALKSVILNLECFIIFSWEKAP